MPLKNNSLNLPFHLYRYLSRGVPPEHNDFRQAEELIAKARMFIHDNLAGLGRRHPGLRISHVRIEVADEKRLTSLASLLCPLGKPRIGTHKGQPICFVLLKAPLIGSRTHYVRYLEITISEDKKITEDRINRIVVIDRQMKSNDKAIKEALPSTEGDLRIQGLHASKIYQSMA